MDQLNINVKPTPELREFIRETTNEAVKEAVRSLLPKAEPKYITRQAYAERMGISLGSVDNAIKRGEITPKRIGKRVLIPVEQ